ncbi:hypothetical protein ACTNBL_05920 [Enterococcus villorum]|uniref:hypothetical protein n=1 Tax=Enterococcus villorum TaxID=112904 RepID=UPI003F8B91B2
MTTKNLKNFERQAEILALTLGLEDNNKFKSRGAGGRDHYQSLFSIYIKMIKDSEHNTFINNESKPQVIQSLQRTIDFYNTKKKRRYPEFVWNFRKKRSYFFYYCSS